MRAVIYARYSSDNQREASIDDQIRTCTAFILRRGWTCVTTYSDQAISGASTLRPGYQSLLQSARTGAYDVLVAESLDRLSRDQADIASLYKQLSFHGIAIATFSEGDITELHVGLKGTMNALYLKDLAQKTRRGLEGRVRSGKSGGGLAFGYDIVVGDAGARCINAAEAEIVGQIFREYNAGRSPRAIARNLNKNGVPGPQGREWRDTAIRGHVKRGTGILNNELYIGRLVWNRLTYVKDPLTGRRQSRINPNEQWIVEDVPALRIVDDDLWQAVKRRQSVIRDSEGTTRSRATRFWERRRERHLLTGLVFCGHCGGRLASVGKDYLACSAARGRGTCANRTSLRRSWVEKLLLDGLQKRLMAPDLVEEFIIAFQAEVNRQRRESEAALAADRTDLKMVERKIAGLLDAIAEGLRGPDLQDRLDQLAARRDAIARTLAESSVPPIRLHPGLAQIYKRKIERLSDALHESETREEAIHALRGLIDKVVVHHSGNGFEIEIVGQIAGMVELGLEDRGATSLALSPRERCSVKVVAGAGFEPATFRL